MIRRSGALVALAVALLGVCGCDPWDSASFGPPHPVAFGARVADGNLRVWTGSPCGRTTQVMLSFEPSRAELVLTASSAEGVTFERITLGGPYPPGLEVSRPLPDGFDWRSQQSMRISVDSDSDGWGTSTDLTLVIRESGQHPKDAYWFQDVGWLDPAEVAAQDGKTFLATCTDPRVKTGSQ